MYSYKELKGSVENSACTSQCQSTAAAPCLMQNVDEVTVIKKNLDVRNGRRVVLRQQGDCGCFSQGFFLVLRVKTEKKNCFKEIKQKISFFHDTSLESSKTLKHSPLLSVSVFLQERHVYYISGLLDGITSNFLYVAFCAFKNSPVDPILLFYLFHLLGLVSFKKEFN